MKKLFFHVHLWKTAGTSFFNICAQNFGKGFHRDTMLVQHWSLSREQLEWLVRYHQWLKCYSCHMLSGDLPYDKKDAEVIGISFVRNPVNRYISSYNMGIGERYRSDYAKQHPFDIYCDRTLVKYANPMWRNGQTFVLGGSGTEEGLAKVAERMQKGQLIVLPTERFDESCVMLERKFPDDFKDTSYIRLNISKQQASVSDSQRAVVAKYMDIDFKLLDLANNYLDSALDQLFPSMSAREQYVEDFRRRCKKKKQHKRLVNTMKNPMGAVKNVINRIKK